MQQENGPTKSHHKRTEGYTKTHTPDEQRDTQVRGQQSSRETTTVGQQGVKNYLWASAASNGGQELYPCMNNRSSSSSERGDHTTVTSDGNFKQATRVRRQRPSAGVTAEHQTEPDTTVDR